MSDRVYSIILLNDDSVDNVRQSVNQIKDFGIASNVYVFSKTGIDDFNVDENGFKCQNVVIPDAITKNSAIKNFVNSTFKNNGFKGFLHVVEDSVKFMKNPKTFVESVERVMDVLDYSVYFSTTTDRCNYVYSKFNPRMTVALDCEQFKTLSIPEKISFTSHANTAYVVYDFNKIEDDLLAFNEKFDIPMFYIIEFLARRRNNKKPDQLYLMNQYLSIHEEIGVFEYFQTSNSSSSSELMQLEDIEFKKMNINFSPDNDIDQLLVKMYNKLKSKM